MSFDVAAEAYDAFMGRYSRLLSGQLADLASVDGGQRALDVGCGTGALTSELAARLGPSAVAAVDPSASFVAAIRERHPGVDVRQAPAELLPFADGAFDAVLAQLVVHFLEDPVAGLAEMARVTRRDGVVAACVWDHAGQQGPLRLFWEAARSLDPEVDDESAMPGTREGHLVELFGDAGLRASRERRSPSASSTRPSTPGGTRSRMESDRPAPTWRASTRTGAPRSGMPVGDGSRPSRSLSRPSPGRRAASPEIGGARRRPRFAARRQGQPASLPEAPPPGSGPGRASEAAITRARSVRVRIPSVR